MDDSRPDPDALVAAAAREGRGRLKVFLGAAPGVGKTYEMLAAARRLQEGGADVLVGVVETHGRAETEAQIGGLPILPYRSVPYRGQVLQEFDVDAALARRPGLLLVDELAHTNAPGSRHAKRWEDVNELLDAGIAVWATLNVQHLESLNEAVARITGVRVSETLPDRVLEGANEVELIDIPPAELQARLREGRIYRPDVATRALDGFFKGGNLAALREIALRQVAAHVDEDVRDYMRRNAISGPWPASDRVLALVGGDANAVAVVRQAKRLSDALHAPWIVVHIERSRRPTDASAALSLATQLGAEVETRAGPDLVAVVLELAQRRNVTQMVIGRGRPLLWRRMLGRTLSAQLLMRAPEFALHFVPASGAASTRRLPRVLEGWLAWGGTTALVTAITGAGVLLGDRVLPEAMGMIYLAAVVAAASAFGLRIALFSAALGFLAWDFFFIPPLYSITISSARDGIALVVFILVAALTGSLASRVRTEAQAGQARIEGLRRIAGFSRSLGEPTTEPELLAEIARQAAGAAGRAVVLTGEGADLAIRAAEPPADAATVLDDGSWAAARWCSDRQEATGRGTATLPSAEWRFLPMRTVRGLLGVVGVHMASGRFDPTAAQTLATLADQAAVALERVKLANEAARSAAMEETQKLRTALLNSLSHDLRTPLTGIRGAADTLGSTWDRLTPATRADLLASIKEDTARMTRFLANIMDLTRLESGQVSPRLTPVQALHVIDAAIARVPDADNVLVNVPPDLPALRADPALLEQALVNVLDNAVRYAPLGSVLRIRGSAGAGQVSLEVIDEGVGISAEDLPHVFDSFYRARRGDRTAPGTGLGLAIARGMMEAMGGTIEAISPRPDAARDGSPGTIVVLRLSATSMQGTLGSKA